MKTIKVLAVVIITLLALNSCEKEPKLEQKYLDLEMLDDWQDFEIDENQEIIFKVTITNETRLDLSWKDEPAMKTGDPYTGDITVSVYHPDGATPYFEEKDNGYKDDSEMIQIQDGDTQVIIIVNPKAGKAGTFTIRARGLNDDLEVTNPKTIDFGAWVDKNCNVGDTKWLKVDCGSETDIELEWKEFDRQEAGETYTADVQVSVFSEELDLTYIDAKNHGYNGDPRTFTLTHSSSIIYIRVTLNDDAHPGSYAIRAFAQAK